MGENNNNIGSGQENVLQKSFSRYDGGGAGPAGQGGSSGSGGGSGALPAGPYKVGRHTVQCEEVIAEGELKESNHVTYMI